MDRSFILCKADISLFVSCLHLIGLRMYSLKSLYSGFIASDLIITKKLLCRPVAKWNVVGTTNALPFQTKSLHF